MTAERRNLLTEVDLLGEKVDHIKSIISTQQAYAHSVSYKEPLELGTVVPDVLAMQRQSLTNQGIEVVTEFEELPTVHLPKSKMVQVLDNLIRNSVESMASSSIRVLRVAVEACARDRVRITVADTGSGIAPENLKTIFNYGFTTKPKGNGFGLHSSALAVSELGGTIKAHSDGEDKGATLTIEFPIAETDSSATSSLTEESHVSVQVN